MPSSNFSKAYQGKVEKVTVSDDYGELNIYLLPFVRPYEVRRFYPDENITSYETAISCIVKNINADYAKRNIILAHQNIINAVHSESEEAIIGGLDAISAEIFKDFDYAALGHIHKQQKILQNIYYSGTPLKYSISEKDDDKSLLLLDVKEKGNIEISSEKLIPLREVREITGNFDEILDKARDDPYNKDDYISIVLKNENEVIDALSSLRRIYPKILSLKYEKQNFSNESIDEETIIESLQKPLELFEDFYKQRVGKTLTDEQRKFMSDLIEETWSEE